MKKQNSLTGEYATREKNLLRRANFEAGVYRLFGMNESANKVYDRTNERIQLLREEMFDKSQAENRPFYLSVTRQNSKLMSALLDNSTGALIASL